MFVVCFNKDRPDKQTDSVKEDQETAAADSDADTPSLQQSNRQSRHQSAYGAWQTVQQDV